MRLVAGSIQPPADVLPDGGRPDGLLRWTFGAVPLSGLPELKYRLEPLAAGLWPTNVEAYGDYVDGLDHPGRSVFPVPQVEVLGAPTPTDEPTPLPDTPAPSATPSPTGTGPPPPPPTLTPPPTTRSRWAIYLPRLEVWRCQRSQRPVDVVLAIDTSASMAGDKIVAAQRAAATFVSLLDLRDGADRAAVVGFHSSPTLAQPLTHSPAAVIAGLESLTLSPGTRIDLGLALARAELTGGRRRVGADMVIVLLTDGLPQPGSEADTVAEGQRARTAGIALWAIGLGQDVAAATLAQITGTPARVLLAPNAVGLEAVYRQVAGGIVCR
jgi:uncharacterized protein YegL